MSDAGPPAPDRDRDLSSPAATDRPGGLVGLLVGGVEAVLALMGRMLAGLLSAIVGSLTGGPNTGEEPASTEEEEDSVGHLPED